MGRGKDKRKSPKRQSETKGEAKKNGAKVKSEEVKVRMGKVKVKRGEGQKKNMDFRMEKPPIGKTFFANEKNKCAKNTIVTRKNR